MRIQFSIVDRRARFLPAVYHSERTMLFRGTIDSEKEDFRPLENVVPLLRYQLLLLPSPRECVSHLPVKTAASLPEGLSLGFERQLLNTQRSSLCFSSLDCFLSARAAPGTDSSQYKYEPESHYEGPFREKPNTIGLCGDIPKRVQSSLRQEWIQELKLSLLYLSYSWLCGLV